MPSAAAAARPRPRRTAAPGGRGGRAADRRARGAAARHHGTRGLCGVSRREPADVRDRQQTLERGVEVRQLQGGRRAARALLEVAVELAVGAHPQAAAGVGAEPVRVAGALALGGERLADVGLEVRLAQSLAGAVGEYRRGVGRQPQQRRDVAGRLLLHRGVPQHRLPPLGQRAEGADRQRALGLAHGEDVGTHVGAPGGGLGTGCGDGEHREVLDQVLAAGGAAPGGGDPPDGGEQVGAYRGPGAAAAPDGLEGAGEDLAGEVLGGVGVAAAGAGIAANGVDVPAVQLAVRAVPASPDLVHQLGVGQRRAVRRLRPAAGMAGRLVVVGGRGRGGRYGNGAGRAPLGGDGLGGPTGGPAGGRVRGGRPQRGPARLPPRPRPCRGSRPGARSVRARCRR